MFKPSPLVRMADEAILDHIIFKLQAQGNIRIGAHLRGPVDIIWDGKLVSPKLDLPVVSLKNKVPHIKEPQTHVSVSRTYLRMDQLDNIQLPGWAGAKWLYPWSVTVPHRDWMVKHKPGDLVNAFDTENETSPYTLTEQDFIDHEILLFSYALSL